MLERGEITLYQFNAALRHRKGPCPRDCPDRHVYCKRECPVWKEHEALNNRINSLRAKYASASSAESHHRLKAMKIGQR